MRRSKVWQIANKEKSRVHAKRKNLKKNYGVSLEWYESQKKLQNNLCAICKNPETAKIRETIKELSVDHNHKTEQIRGLLCSDCNRGLGLFKESILYLESAIKYLENYHSSR